MRTLTLQVIATILFSASLLCGQQISGSIIGVVKDSQQASVGNAKINLNNQEQGTTRDGVTGADGSFVFAQVQPGYYTLTVEATGFKKFEQKDIKVFPNDRVGLGDIVLTVGALNETVTVEAQVAAVQTASAERAGVLTGRQVTELAENGRSLFDLTRVLPGVVYTGGLGGIMANGNRSDQNNFTLDGVTNVDTGSNGGTLATTNIDMIAEMKVITNSQGAEFGRASGAQIEVVTKSGSMSFHGTGYFFHRHEDLNANSWRNNADGRPKDFYRYNTEGFNVGGPAYIPGKFNRNKDKLFFFVGIEWQGQLVPQGLHNVTVPTAAERAGDFSQTHDGGSFSPNITIFDPLNGKKPFPGNIIPKDRFNPDGVKILNWYPQPNALGKDPSYNYQTSNSNTYPRREEIYRGDYNITDKWRTYARYIRNKDETSMAYGQWNASYNIPFGPMSFGAPGWSFVTNVTTIINPTLTNEFVFGSSRNDLHITPITDAFNASKVGVSYKMPFPNADTLQLVQNWNYGGVPNAPTSGFAGTPFLNFNHTYDITDSVNKVHGTHTIKAGIYLHKSNKDQTAFTSVNGSINFGRDANKLVRWNLRDETGKPTLAAFVIRDAQGRIYPPQSKRLAPDSAFHPQVYRGEGELLTLPAGAYTVEFSRGPESRSKTSMLSVAETAAGGPLQEATFQVERWIDPANFDWWSGDHHIHGAGCAHYTRPTDGVAPQDMLRQTRGEDLKVGAVLVWGQGFDYQAQFFTGQDDPVSQPLYRVHYDVEVSGFGSHFSGHLILLGLRELIPPGAGSYEGWPTLCLNTLRWAKRQGAVCGPAHSGWGLGVESTDLPNYLLPPFDGIGANEYIVDVTHEVPGPDGTLTPAVDFLGVADSSIVSELNIWYHTLNVGFRTRIGGETDFPCGSSDRVGMGRSYVKLDGRLDYAVWCVGLRRGRAYVSDGKSHLLEFRVNDVALGEHGSEVRLAQPGTVRVHVKASALLPAAPTPSPTRPDYFWDLERARVGESRGVSVEIVVNGFPVATQALVADGTMRDLTFDVPIARSSWLAVRILHSSHTNPIWVLVGGSPVRASRRSAEWCLRGVDQCWSQKERFIAAAELDQAGTDYEHARQTYRRLLAECDVD